MAKFCTHCGNQIDDNAVVCLKCGCAVNDSVYNSSGSVDVVNVISQRITTNGIIWIVIAAIQILIGISGVYFTLIVGILNLISAIKDMNYAKEFPQTRVGIVDRVRPLTGAVITLIYNLVIGGVIGVAGSIYYFVAVRGYVLENEQRFMEIERRKNSMGL